MNLFFQYCLLKKKICDHGTTYPSNYVQTTGPYFGYCDLNIDLDNPANSMSNPNYHYKDLQSDSLAGRYNNWPFEDVEIYIIKDKKKTLLSQLMYSSENSKFAGEIIDILCVESPSIIAKQIFLFQKDLINITFNNLVRKLNSGLKTIEYKLVAINGFILDGIYNIIKEESEKIGNITLKENKLQKLKEQFKLDSIHTILEDTPDYWYSKKKRTLEHDTFNI